MSFTAGDKVICTDDVSWGPGTIIIGGQYTIRDTLILHDIESVTLMEFDKSFVFYARRFVPLFPETKKEVDFFTLNRAFS